jgi:hypothetical protein
MVQSYLNWLILTEAENGHPALIKAKERLAKIFELLEKNIELIKHDLTWKKRLQGTAMRAANVVRPLLPLQGPHKTDPKSVLDTSWPAVFRTPKKEWHDEYVVNLVESLTTELLLLEDSQGILDAIKELHANLLNLINTIGSGLPSTNATAKVSPAFLKQPTSTIAPDTAKVSPAPDKPMVAAARELPKEEPGYKPSVFNVGSNVDKKYVYQAHTGEYVPPATEKDVSPKVEPPKEKDVLPKVEPPKEKTSFKDLADPNFARKTAERIKDSSNIDVLRKVAKEGDVEAILDVLKKIDTGFDWGDIKDGIQGRGIGGETVNSKAVLKRIHDIIDDLNNGSSSHKEEPNEEEEPVIPSTSKKPNEEEGGEEEPVIPSTSKSTPYNRFILPSGVAASSEEGEEETPKSSRADRYEEEPDKKIFSEPTGPKIIDVKQIQQYIASMPDLEESEVRGILIDLVKKAFNGKEIHNNEKAQEIKMFTNVTSSDSQARKDFIKLVRNWERQYKISPELRRDFMKIARGIAKKYEMEDEAKQLRSILGTLNYILVKQKRSKEEEEDLISRIHDMKGEGMTIPRIADHFNMDINQIKALLRRKRNRKNESFEDYLNEPTFRASKITRLLEDK